MSALNRCSGRGAPPTPRSEYRPYLEQLEDRLILCVSPGCLLSLTSVPTDLGPVVDIRFIDSIGITGESSFLVESATTGKLDITLRESGNLQTPVQLVIVDPQTNQVVAAGERPANTPMSMPGGGGSNDSITKASPSGLNGSGLAVGGGTIGDGAFSGTTGDYDFYRFTATAGQRVNIDIDSSSPTLDSVIAIYDSTGTLIGQNDDDGLTTDSFFAFTTPAAGDYFVVVFGNGSGLPNDPFTEGTGNGPGSTGTYDISIEILNPLTVSVPVFEGQQLLVVVTSAGSGDFSLAVSNADAYSSSGSTKFLVPSGGTPDDVVIADVDGDSIPDLIVVDDQDQFVRVLLGNGDGTFQAPSFDVIGAGTMLFRNPVRRVAFADLDSDSNLDLITTNPESSDVSVLFGNGDGLSYHRRFDAARTPSAIAVGDFNGDGIPDLVVADAAFETPSGSSETNLSVLLGRGDGTFTPQLRNTFATKGVASLVVASLNQDELDDLILFGSDGTIYVLLAAAGGNFSSQQVVEAPGSIGDAIAADLNGDGHIDLAGTLRDGDSVFVLWGLQAGGFSPASLYFVGPNVQSLAVADVAIVSGGETSLPDGTAADQRLDLIVTTRGDGSSPGKLAVLAQLDPLGGVNGFGSPLYLTEVQQPTALAVGDVNGDDVPDIIVAEQRGLVAVFTQPPTIAPNTTPANAMELGTVTHVVLPKRTITASNTEAWYTFTVPAEDAPGAGDQVVDVSALFEYESGPGLQMEVFDSSNTLLGTGPRLRLVVPQGERLTIHVSGVLLAPNASGAYTLAIDVLPQVVAVDALSLLPSSTAAPGGPVTTLVVTLQGDFLDREAAQDPANYQVTYLGSDGVFGTADDQIIEIGGPGVEFPVVYTPNSKLTAGSGQTFPTGTRQTVTLNFASGLPAGSYVVELSPDIQTKPFSDPEAQLLAQTGPLGGHGVVQVDGPAIKSGAQVELVDLVMQQGELDLDVFSAGNGFLTQLHDDLSSLLDAILTEIGDAPSVTASLIDQLQFRIAAGLGQLGQRDTSLFVLLLDPVSINLADPNGNTVDYDLQTGSVVNNIPRTYVEVAGNIELIVVADALGAYGLQIKDVPTQPRGAVGTANNSGSPFESLTEAIRSGTLQFTFAGTATPTLPPGGVPSSPVPTPPTVIDVAPTFFVASSPLDLKDPKLTDQQEDAAEQEDDSAVSVSEVVVEEIDNESTTSSRREDHRLFRGGLSEFLRTRLPSLVGLWEELVAQLRTLWLRILKLRAQ